MHIQLCTELKIKTIGDPHLGRNFSVGTAPHRKGEREQGQLNQLALELMDSDCNVNIMMGDIFDKFIVDPTIVMAAYQIYAHAATQNPGVDYVLLRGNHDVSRDNTRFSSFDLLVHMLRGFKNIIVVEDLLFYTSRDQTTMLMFCGYNPFATAEEMSEAAGLEDIGFVHAVFGHWDIESYGGDDHNLCPYQYFGQYTDLIVTGHVHQPQTFFVRTEDGKKIPKDLTAKYQSVEVIVTGSMQPYSHGEDPDGMIYVTKTLDEYEAEIAVDPAVYHDKCLRLLISPEDELPDNIDALQFAYKVVRPDVEDVDLEVDMGQFDFKSLFMETLEAHGVDEDYRKEMWETYLELSSDVEES